MKQTIALFGEAEKGAFKMPHMLRALPQVVDLLGNPPEESEGLFYAVQAILYNREILYFRVAEEGFSDIDYFSGLKYLEKTSQIQAIFLPGVGDQEILEATQNICRMHKSLLIMTQRDFYDFLTT